MIMSIYPLELKSKSPTTKIFLIIEYLIPLLCDSSQVESFTSLIGNISLQSFQILTSKLLNYLFNKSFLPIQVVRIAIDNGPHVSCPQCSNIRSNRPSTCPLSFTGCYTEQLIINTGMKK